ncbi:jg19179 [Pararge aegeria aegeria]|uniref:Jg19178 protein n=1 Tax=Pararge aegeria aegeria TaxID=348720 RepID=A0A8S4R991_9NEOP|nr:jg19178 [Pararge aegeria aegeria]CAH2230362.1 jg19179 [Pararge aegeria aegeria]
MIVDRSGNLFDTTNIPSKWYERWYLCAGDRETHSNGERCLTRFGSIWKNRGITFNTKSRLDCVLMFPIFMYGVETWTIKAREKEDRPVRGAGSAF